ncbi:hypothetical protein ACTOV4_02750 [Brucella sp. C7-11G]
MTTHISTNTLGLAHQGGIYIATTRSGSIVSDNPQELIETLKQTDEASQHKLFGDVATWTFIRSDSASDYEPLVEQQARVGKQPKYASTLHVLMHMQVSQGTKDAADWIAQNAKHKVQTWVVPGTDLWYWMFEDAQEAVLFRLAVTL